MPLAKGPGGLPGHALELPGKMAGVVKAGSSRDLRLFESASRQQVTGRIDPHPHDITTGCHVKHLSELAGQLADGKMGEPGQILNGDLPGVSPENLDIQFENEQLVIHARVTPRDENRKQLYTEYGVGDFHRSFTIGESIDGSKISAELSGGVLAIHLPKSEQVKPRRIEVKAT